MTIGEKILNMRKARGWSQEELAERVGVSRQAVSRWEAGSAKPDADKIIILCDLFGISADYLLRDDYRGERTSVVLPQSEPKRTVNVRRKLGQILAAESILCLFALKFISSVSPRIKLLYTYTRENGTLGAVHARGLRGFLMYYNLEWFFFLVCGCLLAGVILIWKETPSLREKTAALLDRGRAMLRRK